MNAKNTLLKEIENLPESMLAEVLDFVRFLEQKKQDENETESSLKKEGLSPAEDEATEREDDTFFNFITDKKNHMKNKDGLKDISAHHDKYLY